MITNFRYRPDIDGLRALAVLPVIFFHADLGFPGGFVGVDIFFVISGFLITGLILKEVDEGHFSMVNFWERRVRRILPALLVVVLATLAAGWIWFLPGDYDTLGRSVMAQVVLLSNVYFFYHTGYFAGGGSNLPLLHTWSLAVEEQFYVLFPLIVYFLHKNRFYVARTIMALGAVSFAWSVAGTYYQPNATFYLLHSRAWELMLGAFLAALPAKRHLTRVWATETVALAGLGLIIFAIACYTPQTRFPGLGAVPPCLGAALIIYAASTRMTLVSRLLVWRPVVFIGLVSYSLYLWHWPLLVIVRNTSLQPLSWPVRVLLLVISLLLATASWQWIETPFRKRRWFAHQRQIFAFGGVSLLGLLLCGSLVHFTHGLPSRMPARAVAFEAARKDFAFRNEITPAQAAAGQFAELGGQPATQPVEILLWGDSHAMSVAPVLDDLCRKYARRGVAATHSATAPLLNYASHVNEESLQDREPAFAQAVVDYVNAHHVKKVFLAARWSYYQPVEQVAGHLTETVRALRATGASVYVVKDVPRPDFDVPRLAALAVVQHRDLASLNTAPAKYHRDNASWPALAAAATQAGATVLDTGPSLLNSQGQYDIIRDDQLLYYDNHHLTVAGARVLTPLFEPLFARP